MYMKKTIFIFAALSLGLVACNKEMENPVPEGARFVKITAVRETPGTADETKSTVTNAGVFAWSSGDKIQVYNGTGFSSLGLSNGAGTASADFSGVIPEPGTVSKVAVFPANETNAPALSDNTLTLHLPNEIVWVNGEADNLMIAKGFEEGATNLSFKNIGGLIKVTLKNVPATANKVTFTTGKRISGEFTCDISVDSPVITAGTDSEDDLHV